MQVILDAVLATLLAGGVAALVKLAREVSQLRGSVVASLKGFDARLSDHQPLHTITDERISTLERLNMERAR